MIYYDELNHGIKFSIIDTGNGVKKTEISNLFKQYCQTSCSNKFNSNGLGLCISQKMANLLGGYINVISEYGKGSTFTLFHPISLEQSGIMRENDVFNQKMSSVLENMTIKILTVDDNETNLYLLRLMLEHINHKYKSNIEIHSVKDGKEAIEICKINVYKFIFMDINMPNIDGTTAAKIIKMNPMSYITKIIATTGNISAKKENSAYFDDSDKYSYFDSIIIKPFTDVEILKTLVKYLYDNN